MESEEAIGKVVELYHLCLTCTDAGMIHLPLEKISSAPAMVNQQCPLDRP